MLNTARSAVKSNKGGNALVEIVDSDIEVEGVTALLEGDANEGVPP
jgi:hypothetical protein